MSDEKNGAAPAAPAGWYPGEGDNNTERYWDGVAWTETRIRKSKSSGKFASLLKTRKGKIAAGVIGLAAVAAVGVVIVVSTSGPNVLEKALATCSLTGAAGVSLGDGGKSLTVNTKGNDDTDGASIEDLTCVLGAVETSDSVIARMNTTRALDGVQQGSWKNLEASWSYHPDSGFNLVLTEK